MNNKLKKVQFFEPKSLLITCPTKIIKYIYSILEDVDQFMLSMTCKALNNKQYLVFERNSELNIKYLDRCKTVHIDNTALQSRFNECRGGHDCITEHVILDNCLIVRLPRTLNSLTLLNIYPKKLYDTIPFNKLTSLEIDYRGIYHRNNMLIGNLMEAIEKATDIKLESLKITPPIPRPFIKLPSTLRRLNLPLYEPEVNETNPLPNTITHLLLGGCVVSCLPTNLIQLTLYVHENQTFSAGLLPASLPQLELKGSYNKPFPPDFLPPSLNSLKLQGCPTRFEQPLDEKNLPPSLRSLEIIGHWKPPHRIFIPEGVERINLESREKVIRMPSTLLHLIEIRSPKIDVSRCKHLISIQTMINHASQLIPKYTRRPLPSVQSHHLFIYTRKRVTLEIFPLALTHLDLGSVGRIILPAGCLPSTLQYLELPRRRNIDLEGVLPPNLKYLDLGIFTKEIGAGVLPESLETLVLQGDYQYELDADQIPRSLKYLKLDDYRHKFGPGVLPDTLLSLTISIQYQHNLNNLPKSFRQLILIPITPKPSFPFISNFPVSFMAFHKKQFFTIANYKLFMRNDGVAYQATKNIDIDQFDWEFPKQKNY